MEVKRKRAVALLERDKPLCGVPDVRAVRGPAEHQLRKAELRDG